MEAYARTSAPRETTAKARRRLILSAVAILLSIVGVGPYLLARASVPVTYSEADLDHDGWVSPGEGLYISDAGTRPVQRTGKQSCVEYFALKDGLPIKTVCR